jgi:nucleotide-binding universal stress UspA family protein
MNAIVVGTDGSSGAEAAVRKVIELASGSGATVHLVCAYPGRSTLERLGLTAKTDAVDMRGVAVDVLARDERRFEEAGFEVETHAQEGDPADTLAAIATETKADLIAIGSHGTSALKRFALGSVASKLSHHSPASLLIVRED